MKKTILVAMMTLGFGAQAFAGVSCEGLVNSKGGNIGDFDRVALPSVASDSASKDAYHGVLNGYDFAVSHDRSKNSVTLTVMSNSTDDVVGVSTIPALAAGQETTLAFMYHGVAVQLICTGTN